MVMNINDVVFLKDNIQTLSIPVGTLGTIIEILEVEPLAVYEIEFIDENGKQIDCLTLNENQISKFAK